MEKRTGLITTQKELQPQSILEQGLRWENFDSTKVTLTDEEKDFALKVALEKKIAEIKEILWYEKVNRKKEPMKLNPDQILHLAAKYVCSDANINIGDFVKSKEFEIYRHIALYFSGNEAFEIGDYSLHKSIYLFGNVGCGKTTLMHSFRMIGIYSFPVIACNKVANDYKKEGVEAIEKYINLPAVCFDDLGTEASSKHFGDEKNVMAEIILGRYEKEVYTGFKTHFTSNITADQIEEYYGMRVRSRMREMCNQIEFPVESTDKRK